MPSFDVVCRVDLQEVDNAIQQTLREVGQRFDFKEHADRAAARRDGASICARPTSSSCRALGEILRERLARRQVPLKALEVGPVEPGPAGTAKQRIDLQQGIATDKAREIVKLVKDTKLKVQVAIQGDQVRVSGQEAGRSAGRHAASARARPRHRHAVHQLP